MGLCPPALTDPEALIPRDHAADRSVRLRVSRVDLGPKPPRTLGNPGVVDAHTRWASATAVVLWVLHVCGPVCSPIPGADTLYYTTHHPPGGGGGCSSTAVGLAGFKGRSHSTCSANDEQERA